MDANQHEIVQALVDAGYSVAATSRLGQGFPDLVVGDAAGYVWLIEVKMPGETLTDDQVVFHKRFNVAIVETPEQALAAVGYYER